MRPLCLSLRLNGTNRSHFSFVFSAFLKIFNHQTSKKFFFVYFKNTHQHHRDQKTFFATLM